MSRSILAAIMTAIVMISQTYSTVGSVALASEQSDGNVSVESDKSATITVMTSLNDHLQPQTPDSSYAVYSWDQEQTPLDVSDSLTITGNMTGATEMEGRAESTDTSVVRIDEESQLQRVQSESQRYDWYVMYHMVGAGKADIRLTIGGAWYTIHVYSLVTSVKDIAVARASRTTAHLTWTPTGSCDGYNIYVKTANQDYSQDEYRIYATVGPDATSADLMVDRRKMLEYTVIPYMQLANGILYYDEQLLTNFYGLGDGSVSLCLDEEQEKNPQDRTSDMITGITNGSKSQKISWRSITGAASYEVMRSELENGGYKKVATADKGVAAAECGGVRQGHTYYYRIAVIYPDGSREYSGTLSKYMPVKKPGGKKAVQVRTVQQYVGGAYWDDYFAWPDEVYYYKSGNTLHEVALKDSTLYDYTLTGGYRIKSTRKIKIGSYDRWGGFYHGEDGRNYVVLGWSNQKESRKKTVIKVIQYSGKWKKLKTCNIKGNASNGFEGIYIPFRSGNCSMAMMGDRLIMFFSRSMFADKNDKQKLHHQSDIGVEINTGTMKYREANMTYVSHSFNQLIRVRDGSVYQLDHGDAYPRAIKLTITPNYDAFMADQDGYSDNIINIALLKAKGKTGDNYTGMTAGGMEAGKDCVITVGTSRPQGEKIAGITGNSSSLHDNVFMTVTSTKTLKTTFRWITKYNPKKTKTTVGETRLVKISDEQFALMYSTYDKKGRGTLHYELLSDKGKTVRKKSYTGMVFTGAVQPVFFNGRIFWSDVKLGSKKDKVYNYSIPVLM